MSQISEILVDIIATALSTAMLCLISAGARWLGTKIKNEKVQLAIQEFQTVLEDGVGFTEQTLVRLAKSGGTWDADTQKKALLTCVDYIKSNVTDKAMKILTEDKDDIEGWIIAKIEAELDRQKF